MYILNIIALMLSYTLICMIKLPTSIGSSKKQESSRKTSTWRLCQSLCGTPQTVENSFFFFLKILKEMGIPDHLTCLLRNLYGGQEATVRTGYGKTDCFQIGKGVHQGCLLSPAYLVYMQSTSCEILGWMKHKLESRFLREISITSDTQMIPPLWQKVKKN